MSIRADLSLKPPVVFFVLPRILASLDWRTKPDALPPLNQGDKKSVLFSLIKRNLCFS